MAISLKRKAIAAGGICILAAISSLHAALPYLTWKVGDGTDLGKYYWTEEQTVDFATASSSRPISFYTISPEATSDANKKNLKAAVFQLSSNSNAGHCFELETFSDGNAGADTRFWVNYADLATHAKKWKSLDNNTGTDNLSKARVYIKPITSASYIHISAATASNNTIQFKYRIKRIDGAAGSESSCTTGQSLPWLKFGPAPAPDYIATTFSSNAN
jgi:hypothetical protein